jgi:hypothetical protein
MAAILANLDAGPVPLVANAPKTVLMLTAPPNQVLRIHEVRVTFDGATSTAVPPKVEIGRPTSAGTMSAKAPAKTNPAQPEVLQAIGGVNATLEPGWPAAADETFNEPAYGGMYHYQPAFDVPILVPGGGRFAIRVTAQAPVNCTPKITYAE